MKKSPCVICRNKNNNKENCSQTCLELKQYRSQNYNSGHDHYRSHWDRVVKSCIHSPILIQSKQKEEQIENLGHELIIYKEKIKSEKNKLKMNLI